MQVGDDVLDERGRMFRVTYVFPMELRHNVVRATELRLTRKGLTLSGPEKPKRTEGTVWIDPSAPLNDDWKRLFYDLAEPYREAHRQEILERKRRVQKQVRYKEERET